MCVDDSWRSSTWVFTSAQISVPRNRCCFAHETCTCSFWCFWVCPDLWKTCREREREKYLHISTRNTFFKMCNNMMILDDCHFDHNESGQPLFPLVNADHLKFLQRDSHHPLKGQMKEMSTNGSLFWNTPRKLCHQYYHYSEKCLS